jgi:hypothetical protein
VATTSTTTTPTHNVFAGRHRLDELPRGGVFDAVTAFEVLEHLVDPVADLREVAGLTDVLLATTRMLPDPLPLPEQWDYYSLETGQHVTLYTPKAISTLGRRLGYAHVVSGQLIHLFSRRPVNPIAAMLVRRHQIAFLAGFGAAVPQRRRSLLAVDQADRVG